MDMPKPTPDHERLARLAGTWKGKETMHPSQWDPKGGQADGETRARVALGGFCVTVDYAQTRDGVRTYEGHGVYAWDGGTGEVVLHWFDSMGGTREEFRGGWHGDTLMITSKGPMGFARLTYDFGKPGQLSSTMQMSPDGSKWSTLFDGVYTRSQ
jgi:hypothetical protein